MITDAANTEVRLTPSAGRGVFATEDIPAGSVVWAEAPFVRVPRGASVRAGEPKHVALARSIVAAASRAWLQLAAADAPELPLEDAPELHPSLAAQYRTQASLAQLHPADLASVPGGPGGNFELSLRNHYRPHILRILKEQQQQQQAATPCPAPPQGLHVYGDEDALFLLCLRLRFNCFGSGLYLASSLVNHACRPNCAKFSRVTQTGCGGGGGPGGGEEEAWTEIVSCRDIPKGEELTITYTGCVELSLASRRRRFLHQHCATLPLPSPPFPADLEELSSVDGAGAVVLSGPLGGGEHLGEKEKEKAKEEDAVLTASRISVEEDLDSLSEDVASLLASSAHAPPASSRALILHERIKAIVKRALLLFGPGHFAVCRAHRLGMQLMLAAFLLDSADGSSCGGDSALAQQGQCDGRRSAGDDISAAQADLVQGLVPLLYALSVRDARAAALYTIQAGLFAVIPCIEKTVGNLHCDIASALLDVHEAFEFLFRQQEGNASGSRATAGGGGGGGGATSIYEAPLFVTLGATSFSKASKLSYSLKKRSLAVQALYGGAGGAGGAGGSAPKPSGTGLDEEEAGRRLSGASGSSSTTFVLLPQEKRGVLPDRLKRCVETPCGASASPPAALQVQCRFGSVLTMLQEHGASSTVAGRGGGPPPPKRLKEDGNCQPQAAVIASAASGQPGGAPGAPAMATVNDDDDWWK